MHVFVSSSAQLLSISANRQLDSKEDVQYCDLTAMTAPSPPWPVVLCWRLRSPVSMWLARLDTDTPGSRTNPAISSRARSASRMMF